jgi:hypothetical protein
MRLLTHPRLIWLAYFACVVLFCRGFMKLERRDGATSFIRFGSKFEARSLSALKQVPHRVDPDSYGYDGQFYAQIALSPGLADPELRTAMDNLPYRARRILFSWTAWLLGLGQPAWVIRAYAVQNVLFWLAGSLLLLRWLPPTSWFNFGRWATLLFSAGWLASVTAALLDGPALVVLLLGAWLIDRGRPNFGAAILGLSALGKETNVLAGWTSVVPLDRAAPIKTFLVRGLLLITPLVAWFGYVYWQVGASSGKRNFALPFEGLVGKVGEICREVEQQGWPAHEWMSVLCFASLTVHLGYFLVRWQWSQLWWRLGLPYAILGICLGSAVLEGFPGAYCRALLPLLAAFNLSLKPTKTGWMLLVLGNLGVAQGVHEIYPQIDRLFSW